MDFDLADSSVTDALGRALALAYPGVALEPGAARSGTGQLRAAQTGTALPGAVVYLQGDLGTGKTTCVRSLLRTLGVTGLVRSPTYTLVETYRLAELTCVHVDLYRLQVLTEIDELGLRDLVGPGCLLLVEWAEKGGAALPPADLELKLRYAGESRRARLSARTSQGSAWLRNLGHDNSLAPYVSNLT
jgi:tRNA threonylcarbamoyladenosine biosynthesis protein TsaE